MIIKYFSPAALCLAVITWLSVAPNVPMPKLELFSADKLFHALSYSILSGLLLFGFHRSKGRKVSETGMLLSFLLAAGYGVFMEWVQGTFFPYRVYEYEDMIANAAGALLAVVVYRAWA